MVPQDDPRPLPPRVAVRSPGYSAVSGCVILDPDSHQWRVLSLYFRGIDGPLPREVAFVLTCDGITALDPGHEDVTVPWYPADATDGDADAPTPPGVVFGPPYPSKGWSGRD